ncbi:peptide/nickel transport system substrate-binding protein [Halogranum rubrum]|uniref:Peptide/nickel transport system substrate-binding protein n=1 Tax=Halogranum rubrum TaxID=553466 RepID=A0A1I4GVA8_9EURY|nr:ABC transporter substrate-binding protein [Halogranum rubrum]SFL33905.1 peptide/nickel transport system substrate-binding protein [Halogranum rubrum]
MTRGNRQVTRRQLLGAGGGALAAGLAGCAGGQTNSGSNQSESAGSGGSGSGQALTIMDARQLTKIHFNPFNAANFANSWNVMTHDIVAAGHSDGAVRTDLAEELTTDGKTLTISFPEDRKWWSGDDLTAEDFFMELEITRLQDPESSAYESHELVDDYTIERTFKTETTPELMRASVAGFVVDTPRWIFRDYYERYQEASTQDERDAVTEELLGMTISAQQLVDEGLGNSLYRLTRFNSSEGVLEKFEDHPHADRTDVTETRVIPWEAADPESFIVQDKIDLAFGDYITESKRDRYPDNLENQYELEWFRTQKFTFNYKNEHLAKRNVRRAVACAVDLNSIVAAANQAGIVGTPTQVQTGLRSSIHDRYLGDGFTDKLIQYPVGKDLERATQYMEQAGYSKSNGQWVDDSGSSFSFTIIADSKNAQTQATKVFSDQLNAFGIGTEVQSIGLDYYTKLQEYEFDIAWIWHVAKALWHPTAYYSNNFYGVEVGDPASDDDTGPTGIPFETTIPNQVGAEKTSGSGQTIQPAQLMTDLPVASSTDEVTEMTQTLVQWFNYDLPALVYVQENSGYWGDTANFSFEMPEDETLMSRTKPGRVAWLHGWVSSK